MGRRSKSSSSSRGSKRIINILSTFITIIVVLALVMGFIIASPYNPPRDFLCRVTHIKFFCRGIIDVQTVTVNGDNLYIGLSDGNYAFDIHGPNGADKQQAIQDLNNGNINAALNDWNQAVSITTDDAESLIYIENAHVATSGLPFVTIAVATTLGQVVSDTSTSIRVAQDDLRGVYLAQRDFNGNHSNLKVRIVLANLGVKAQNYLNQTEDVVLQKLVRLANTDNTFIGVVGFPFSATAKAAIPALSAAHIPIISPSASSTALTNLSPYFFRVVPSDAEQGLHAAQFAAQIFNARHVAVFSDSSNPYSKSLGDSFKNSFSELGSGYVVIPESFQLSNADSLDAPLTDMLSHNSSVDMIFLAGYGDDLGNLKTKLKANATSFPIMGGDAFYEFGGYPPGDYSNFYFTAFTYPDIWNILCPNHTNCTSPAPTATDAKQYRQTFDPKGIHHEYGYDRPGPHVWQSYDATSALLQAAETVQTSGQIFSLQAVRDALQNVSFQGTTGEISFSGSDPVSKTVVMLCIDSNYHTKLVRVYGQFVRGATNYEPSIDEVRNNLCA